jgi:RNA-directed DNA polymerase
MFWYLRRELGRVFDHRGSWEDFQDRLAKAGKNATRAGREGRNIYADFAFKYVADERNLYAAMMHLRECGGWAAGPDGITHSEFPDDPARWAGCRYLRDQIKDQSWKPSGYRIKRIPKASGTGIRKIAIQNLDERVVCRAVKQALDPILDPIFSRNSFGFRPRLNRSHALQRAWELAQAQGRYVWVNADIADAFDHVPLQTVLDFFAHHLPSDELQVFLAKCLHMKKRKMGLLQGSPLSPLCLNLFLHHKLDQAWRRRCNRIPLIRYADDILILAKSRREAKKARGSLDYLLQAAGMRLKVTDEPDFCDLRAGDRATFLGFDCGLVDGSPSTIVARKSIERLKDHLLELAQDENAAKAAFVRLRGWFKSQGPAYSKPHARAVVREIVSCLKQIGVARVKVGTEHTEAFPLGRQRDWIAIWQLAHEKWLDRVGRHERP